jgi:hypothetical protein
VGVPACLLYVCSVCDCIWLGENVLAALATPWVDTAIVILKLHKETFC